MILPCSALLYFYTLWFLAIVYEFTLFLWRIKVDSAGNIIIVKYLRGNVWCCLQGRQKPFRGGEKHWPLKAKKLPTNKVATTLFFTMIYSLNFNWTTWKICEWNWFVFSPGVLSIISKFSILSFAWPKRFWNISTTNTCLSAHQKHL